MCAPIGTLPVRPALGHRAFPDVDGLKVFDCSWLRGLATSYQLNQRMAVLERARLLQVRQQR